MTSELHELQSLAGETEWVEFKEAKNDFFFCLVEASQI